MIDVDDPATAVAVLVACLFVLVLSIVMDRRRLPIGRVKWVPWTMLTITFLLLSGYAARQVAIDCLRMWR